MSIEILLPILFLFIAFFYSSVGFGGGSSYLAIMSIFLVDFYEIRSTALLLNLTVVSIGTLMYLRHRVFDWKLFWPFLLPSVPLAYLGTQMRLSERYFFLILGVLLVLSGLSMLLKFFQGNVAIADDHLWKRMGLGGTIGFFAGLSGIGGGIYLSPVLHLMGWKDARKIASLASIFILVNSLAGLIGLFVANTFTINQELTLHSIGAVVLGGGLGAYLSNKTYNTRTLEILTGILVVYVGIRLLVTHL